MFMANDPVIVSATAIEEAIYLIRGRRVMLDSDLAKIYGVSTSRLNEQVKRNVDRFPEDFAFQLTRQEVTTLKSQFVISNSMRGGRRTLPWVLLAPEAKKRQEMGFHVRSESGPRIRRTSAKRF